MNSFLKSVGYSKIDRWAQVERLLEQSIDEKKPKDCITREDDSSLVEYERFDLAMGGIKFFCEEEADGDIHLDECVPFGKTFDNVINNEDCVYVNKRIETEGFTGMCDDPRLGISLIFYIINPLDYIKVFKESKIIEDCSVQFFAMAQSGKIILPTMVRAENNEEFKKDMMAKNKLLAEAKKGNQEAIESLTISDIDKYAMVSQRIHNEDILSIVDTSIVPYGSESDMYSITGIIEVVMEENNSVTNEKVFHMLIRCNDIPMDVFINSEDLLGEPAVGRRFRGNVWLQGRLVQ